MKKEFTNDPEGLYELIQMVGRYQRKKGLPIDEDLESELFLNLFEKMMNNKLPQINVNYIHLRLSGLFKNKKTRDRPTISFEDVEQQELTEITNELGTDLMERNNSNETESLTQDNDAQSGAELCDTSDL